MKTWEWALVIGAALVALYLVANGTEGSDSVTSTGGGSGVASTILEAISSFENVAASHNNPGGICGSFIGGICQGPATFDSLAQGIDANITLIQSKLDNNPGESVADFVANWSGATGQVLSNYVNAVASDLGLDPTDPIEEAGSGDD
jgi:hypothetical protein